MQIVNELQSLYARQKDESLEQWLARLIGDFLNLNEEVPLKHPLVNLGITSLSSAILVEFIQRETGAKISLDYVMSEASVNSIAKNIEKAAMYEKEVEQ